MEKQQADFNNFIGLYQVPKTLRFELRPIGKTLENFRKTGFLERDEERAQAYPVVKDLIDEFHKSFITKSLQNADLDWQPLADAIQKARTTHDRTLELEKELKKCQDDLRAKIVKNYFEKSPEWAFLFEEKLIAKLLEQELSEKKQEALATFKRFTGYFLGFHENRKNFYVKEAQTTAIAYRLVHDNFPRFLNNCAIWAKIREQQPDLATQISEELADVLQGRSLDDVFTVQAYNQCLTQPGIDAFNLLLGGRTDQIGERKKQGVNEALNLFFQQHPELSKHSIGLMTPLYKQILSDRETFSFQLNAIDSDEKLAEIVDELYAQWFPPEGKSPVVILCDILNRLGEFEAEKIWVKALSLSTISQKLYGSWSMIRNALENFAANSITRKTARKRFLKRPAYTLQEIDTYLQESPWEDGEKRPPVTDFWKDIASWVENLKKLYGEARQALQKSPDKVHSLRERTDDVEKLKAFLDCCMDFLRLVEPLAASDDLDLDESFYGEFTPAYEVLNHLPGVYSMVRNYITQKLSSEKKIKLNFDCVTLLGGWDENQEKADLCVLFRKDRAYYLGIFHKYHSFSKASGNIPYYEKLVYKQTGNPANLIFNLMEINGETKKVNGHKESEEADPAKRNPTLEQAKNQYLPHNINRIRKSHSYRSGENFCKDDLTAFIAYYQQRLCEYKAPMQLSFKSAEKYSNWDEFETDVKNSGYQISFQNVSAEDVEKMVEKGDLYLFQIWNKDFSPYAHGKPNLHTMYWRALFDPENLRDIVFKLNGEAELFYRKTVLEAPVCHEKGSKLVNRTYRDGNGKLCTIPENIYQELLHFANGTLSKLSAEAEKIQPYAVVKTADRKLVKDRRYTEDKFQFHVPLTINFKADGKSRINDVARQYLAVHPETKIIGIDRGERNLLYLCVIDENGKIMEQRSMNLVGSVDYQDKLDQKEQRRDEARKSWKTIDNIKDLKSGYLSQVINEIVTLMIKHHAIVVLEKLNSGFKRGRFKVEKQVYQKFERALIEKLNYLVFKDIPNSETGSVLKGYQLTEKFESFQKLGEQSGMLFYVPAYYTSKIDPATGFVNLLPLFDLNGMKQRQEFFGKFRSITFDGENFRFAFDYRDLNIKQKDWKNEWQLTSAGMRLKFDLESRTTVEKYPTEMLREAFDEYGLTYPVSKNIAGDLAELPQDRKGETLFKVLFEAFRLIVQMRNSKPDSTKPEDDYIVSPALDVHGNTFDSRCAAKDMPQDADANGAYHIALKGRFLLDKFKENPQADLEITNEDWLKYVQSMRS